MKLKIHGKPSLSGAFLSLVSFKGIHALTWCQVCQEIKSCSCSVETNLKPKGNIRCDCDRLHGKSENRFGFFLFDSLGVIWHESKASNLTFCPSTKLECVQEMINFHNLLSVKLLFSDDQGIFLLKGGLQLHAVKTRECWSWIKSRGRLSRTNITHISLDCTFTVERVSNKCAVSSTWHFSKIAVVVETD